MKFNGKPEDEIEEETIEEETEEEGEDEVDESSDEGEGPADLASAFKLLREQKQAGSEGTVGDGAEGQGEESGSSDEEYEEESDEDMDDGGFDEDGGFPDSDEGVDWESAQKDLVNEIRQQSILQARQKFAELEQKGVRMLNIGDLYSKDKNTGVVNFINPDDPNRPFTSRYEAEQWINSFNNQLKAEFARTAKQFEREIAQQAMPAIKALDFAPRYEQMTPQEQAVFDDIVSDYEIPGQNGIAIGYSCNLDKAADMARRIAAKMQPEEPEVEEEEEIEEEGTEPALDMKGSSGAQGIQKEPKTLEEAMRMYNQNKRNGGR